MNPKAVDNLTEKIDFNAIQATSISATPHRNICDNFLVSSL